METSMQQTMDVQEWVSVKDKLPDIGKSYDVVIEDEYGKRRGVDVNYSKKTWGTGNIFTQLQHTDNGMNWIDITKYVTHWKYLPNLP